eukprot:CAMPEP_0205911322 /NCGR_PEP_ID=MMETSP1325-20131115/5072_1 /ASSEMBLY_ACC=CAM_ASM_000708 /TAXON_ID=236786 /ORGANISM="Florenciella sp., Strain RCC1007" /LENGTH=36 /DNA_ID= /DNA_START= /DNA_END= /DNA_ORIENTATION=
MSQRGPPPRGSTPTAFHQNPELAAAAAAAAAITGNE